MPEPTILDRIVERRRADVLAASSSVSARDLQRRAATAPPVISFTRRLREAGPVALIAEIKRASPSKGDIAPDMDAVAQALRYANAGAAGISVLTEPAWFKGTLDDLAAVRSAVEAMGATRPAVLRKDFIIDEYQVLEARAYGADALLLIVACLDDEALARLYRFTQEMGMEALVEVDTLEGMQRAAAIDASFIGINNRDLRSFTVDLGTTDSLAGLAPPGALLAALSGISRREDVERFAAAGASAVLVGEALMVAGDPAARVRELLGTGAGQP